MEQQRWESLVEQALNTASGFALSLLLWRYVVTPWLGIEYHHAQNVAVTALFTGVSIARGYVWRRLAVRYHARKQRSNHA